MSYWPTGVSLITTLDAGNPSGCTANALTSLSLEPPMLIVCFDIGSRTLEGVRRSGRFCVNVLAADQLEVSRLFATKRSHAEKFDGVGYRIDAEVPVLDGCLAFIVCEVAEEAEGGDHVIVFGRPLVGAHDDAKDPLLFYKSTYWDFIGKSM